MTTEQPQQRTIFIKKTNTKLNGLGVCDTADTRVTLKFDKTTWVSCIKTTVSLHGYQSK